MQKICIIGSGGSGKSTLARKLGAKLNLPVHHLDVYFWNPNWVEGDKDKFLGDIERITAEPKWIMDGNFSGTFHLRLPSADTIIFLDYSRRICMFNILKRYIKWRNKSRPDMAEGCRESIDFEFLKWVWDYPKRSRPYTLKKLEELKSEKNIVILKSRKVTVGFLKEIYSDNTKQTAN